jgi:hypothetical protein
VAQTGETAKSEIKSAARERAKKDTGVFIFVTSSEARLVEPKTSGEYAKQ